MGVDSKLADAQDLSAAGGKAGFSDEPVSFSVPIDSGALGRWAVGCQHALCDNLAPDAGPIGPPCWPRAKYVMPAVPGAVQAMRYMLHPMRLPSRSSLGGTRHAEATSSRADPCGLCCAEHKSKVMRLYSFAWPHHR